MERKIQLTDIFIAVQANRKYLIGYNSGREYND